DLSCGMSPPDPKPTKPTHPTPCLEPPSAATLSHPGLAPEQPRVDAFRLECGAPALVGRGVEQYAGVGARREPAVTRHFLVELALAPAGIAERGDPALGAAPLGDRAQHVDCAGHREKL